MGLTKLVMMEKTEKELAIWGRELLFYKNTGTANTTHQTIVNS